MKRSSFVMLPVSALSFRGFSWLWENFGAFGDGAALSWCDSDSVSSWMSSALVVTLVSSGSSFLFIFDF